MTAVFSKTLHVRWHGLLLLCGLLACDAAVAKTTSHKARPAALDVDVNAQSANSLPFSPAPSLNLNLPETSGLTTEATQKGQSAISKQVSDNALQILAGTKKPNNAVRMDCGMDVMPTSNPDVSLGSRLTGECDFKYRY
jgi:hypothetical protein